MAAVPITDLCHAPMDPYHTHNTYQFSDNEVRNIPSRIKHF